MTDAQQVRNDTETEVIPSLRSGEGLAHTRELPVDDDQAVDARTEGEQPAAVRPAPIPPPPAGSPVDPAHVPPGGPLREPVQESPRQPVAPPAAEPVTEQVPSPAQPQDPGVQEPAAQRVQERVRQPGQRWRNGLLGLVAALVIGGVAAAVMLREGNGTLAGGSSRSGSTGSAVRLSASASSLDPSGGSGFRPEGGTTWRTQTYTSASFGNLKSGVGLLLDVGSPRVVSAVTFEVVGGAVAVELRAGDEPAASEGAYRRVTGSNAASGATTLTAKDGGKHRYWLIWVTRLAAQDGGYRAVLRDPAVKGPAS